MLRSLIALALIGVAAGDARAAPAPALSPADLTYVARAGASDRLEISEGRLADARGVRPRIKAFARMMLRDHARSTALLRAAVRAETDRDPPAPVLDAMQARMLAALRTTPARRFDEVYVAQQVQAHAQALDLHRAYAATGGDAELRQTAQLIAPIVQQHLDMARDLQQRMLARGR